MTNETTSLSPNLFINRELSLLEFQRRVLDEALDERNPLLERLKFLAIFGSNMDEFFMVRLSGIRKQVEARIMEVFPDGLTPPEVLAAARKTSAACPSCTPPPPSPPWAPRPAPGCTTRVPAEA